MARTTIRLNCNNPQESYKIVESILISNKYKNINENNENVWKCGNGFWTAMKYIKVEFSENNTLILSGWIRAMGGSEQNLEGFVGAVPKKQIMDVLKQIQTRIN